MKLVLLLMMLLPGFAFAQPKALERTPCPGDLSSAFPAASKAHDACSPKVGARLVSAYRAGRVDKLVDPAGFLRLAAEYGDPLVNYVLNHDWLFEKDPAAWDSFAANPERYLGVSAPLPKAKPPGPRDPAEPTVPLTITNEQIARGWDVEKKEEGVPTWVLYGAGALVVLIVLSRLSRKPEEEPQ